MTGAALPRLFDLLEEIVSSQGAQSIKDHARKLNLPLSSAHRLLSQLEAAELVFREGRMHFHPGRRLWKIARDLQTHDMLVRLAREPLRQLSKLHQCTAHLGVLEDRMVTYLVKESAGKDGVFSREGMQLEAYCSGIGKVLLSNMRPDLLQVYLAEAPFVALTSKTKSTPDKIRRDLRQVQSRGYATDIEEMAEGLFCLAVPVRDPNGAVTAAISLSFSRSWDRKKFEAFLGSLLDCSALLEARLGAEADVARSGGARGRQRRRQGGR